MPLYEYACLECGEQFEKLVRTNALEDVVWCPKCESDQVERLLSLFSASQGAPGVESPGASKPGALMHKPHCGYDWAK